MGKIILQPFSPLYDAIIINKTSNSTFDILKTISNTLAKQGIKGSILIDNLLHSGNTKERFIEARFENQSFDMNSFKFANISKKSPLRKIICDWLKENPENLESSILTTTQQKMILHGLVI